MKIRNNHIVRLCLTTLLVLLGLALDASAQLPVRTREVQLFSNNNTNYTRLQAVDGQVTNWTLTYPSTVGATGSLLVSTVTGPTAAMSWLSAGANGDLLTVVGGIPTWQDLSTTAWLLDGNPTTTAWNGLAGSFVGTTSTQPLSIATTNAVAQDINFYTGAAGADLRMSISGAGNITLNGTAGTPNVTLTSVSGVANVAIPVGYDRVLVSNATGDVDQTTYSALAAQSSWTLLGNAGTSPATNFLGTTDAQALVLRTNNVERARVNATGELGIGTTAAAGSLLHVGGVAGTPNVRLDATSGVANVTIPVGYDRVLVSNATGDVDQTTYAAIVSASAWILAGNPTTSAWNGAAGSYLGTNTTQPLSIATTNAVAQDINFYTGAAGADLRMTISGAGDITLNGTAGTPNVTLTSVSGVANVAIPVGYDRVLVSNATGDVDQTTYSALAAQSSWTLLGNAGTSPATNFLGTTDAQALVLRTNNVERARVNATGELGIGTTAAAGSLLHVGGVAGTPNVRLDATSGVANVTIPVGYDRVLVSNATGDVDQTTYAAIVSASAWILDGNPTTTSWNGIAGSFLGTTSTQDLVVNTNSAFRARIVGGAVNTGNLVLGTTTASPTNSTAAQAVDKLTILGGDISLNSENNIGITRQITFRGTSGSGNFRIGSDGGDIYWQGGGGRNLQMGSYWGIQLAGQRQVGGAPAFTNGVGTVPHVDVILAQNAVAGLVITPTAAYTANQQEWRNSGGTALSVVNAGGNIGLGMTGGVTAKLQVNSASSTGNAIQLDPYGAAAGNTGQLRFMELAANGTNYAAIRSADNMVANTLYTLPSAFPAANDYVLTSSTAGIMGWADPASLLSSQFWALAGNNTITSWNGLVGSYIGTSSVQPLTIATTNAIAQDIRFYTGAAGANQRMVIAGNGDITLNGTAGTPNLTFTSVSGVADPTIPVGYDRVLLSNALGQVSQSSYAAIANATAWTLAGNASTNPGTNFLGTTDGQPLVVRTNSLERLRVLSTGEVGIGTTTPSTALEVNNGDIQIGTSLAGTAGSLRFEEDAVNGDNYTALRSASSLANDMTYTLPTTIGSSSEYLRIASVPAPTATTATLEWAPIVVTPGIETINVTVDDQAVVPMVSTTFLRLDSDGLPALRTIVFANGVTDGFQIVIRCVAAGANGVQFLDAANLTLSGNFNMNNGDTITLIWDAGTAEWLELARRNN